MFAALPVTLAVARTSESEPTKSFLEFAALFAFGYLGLVLGSGRGGELHPDSIGGIFTKNAAPEESMKLLDTSVLIDGRIADICETQFMEGVLVVPQFVLRELQMVAGFLGYTEGAAGPARPGSAAADAKNAARLMRICRRAGRYTKN
jgi:hypothetical protein